MRALFWLSPMIILAGCAAPTTAYTVAPPDVVASEAAAQEQMIEQGKASTQNGLDRGAPSPSTRFPENQRLAAVGERIMIAAAPFCEGRLTGAYPVSVGTADKGAPTVINAAEPLQPNDRIIAMDGRDIPTGSQGYQILNQQGGQKADTGQPLQLTARRGNQIINATYQPTAACNLPIVIEDSGEWNAYADGQVVHVETKLLRDLTNDDDLAFVIAHEFSHNLLQHVQKQQQNSAMGGLAGLAVEAILAGATGTGMSGQLGQAGAQMGGLHFSQDFEREADYVGLYILAHAGYDLNAGPRVARRIARQDPRSIRYSSTHPSSADRAASLQATIKEIENKERTGQPLSPTAAAKKG